jgi:hypothetical protein
MIKEEWGARSHFKQTHRWLWSSHGGQAASKMNPRDCGGGNWKDGEGYYFIFPDDGGKQKQMNKNRCVFYNFFT